jgi:hypothetical protein
MPPVTLRELNDICQQLRKILDERFALDADDAREAFVMIWLSLINQELPRPLRAAVDRVESSFDIT